MSMKVKEKLIKWSRYVKLLKSISDVCAVVLISCIILIILCNMRIIPAYMYNIAWNILKSTLIFGIFTVIIKDIFNAVKINKEYIYKNNLLYVLLSDKEVVWTILFILFFIISLIAGFNGWLYIVWLILLSIFQSKIANYFKTKLIK